MKEGAVRNKCLCGCGRYPRIWSRRKSKYKLWIFGHHPFSGRTLSPDHKKRISEGGKGQKRSDETRRRISEALKNHEYALERIEKLRSRNRSIEFRQRGYRHSEETRRKISESNKLAYALIDFSGSRNPNWKGGISRLPYPPEWSSELKSMILERDGYCCKSPFCLGGSKRLSVHHIDYNKANCSPDNLITLCFVCNSKANHRRRFWRFLYSKFVREEYGY